jgi:hypothetical protein
LFAFEGTGLHRVHGLLQLAAEGKEKRRKEARKGKIEN